MLHKLISKLYQYTVRSLPDDAAIRLMYLRQTGNLPNLRHPSTFNEKIAWRKINQHDPRFPLLSDKIRVKKHVAELLGEQYVTPTVWTGTEPASIPFGDLPLPFVIKMNNGSGGCIFVRKVEEMDRAAIIGQLRRQLRHSHGNEFREWGYIDIPPQILVEPMIALPADQVPEDYKFFIYDGKARFIQYDCNRFRDHRRNLYDIDWNLLPATLKYPAAPHPIPRPSTLAEMIRIAERIGERFDFVRIDLYSTPKGIRFGEATFYPGSGFERFTPSEWDLRFGEPWHLRPGIATSVQF